MAKIVFLLDSVLSHFIATTGLANDLKERGHEIVYLGIPDLKNEVVKHEYGFHVIFEEAYPPGTMKRNIRDKHIFSYDKHLRVVAEGRLSKLIDKLAPDLLITGYFLSFEAVFLHYLHAVPQVIITTVLRKKEASPHTYALSRIYKMSGEVSDCLINFIVENKLKVKNSQEFIAPLNEIKELIECPEELGFPGINRGSNVYYNFSANFSTAGDDDFIKNLPRGKKIVFLSMGSLIFHNYAKSMKIYKKFLDCMRLNKLPGVHLIISLGKYIKSHELGEIPGNVSVFDWVPQTKLLQYTDLIITHAGLGSVKEALYWQVPIIANPLAYDQPYNATLIEHHKLGCIIDIEKATLAELKGKITGILEDDTIKKNVARMSQIFRKKDKEKNGVKVIEALINQI